MPIAFEPEFWAGSWTHRRGVRDRLTGAILAAGLGRRMDPLTARHLPKPLFPLGGKVRMAEIWVRRLVQSGIAEMSMNLCVLGETIRRYFQDGTRFGARIRFVEEAQPSGTFGGVCKQVLGREAKLLPTDGDERRGDPFQGSTVIVPSADIVTNFGPELLEEMYDVHRRVGAAFTMVVVPVAWERRRDYGTVEFERPETRGGVMSRSGQVKAFYEKDPDSPSNLNNASIYMIEMDLVRALDGLRTEAGATVDEAFYDFGKHVFPALLGKLPYLKLPGDHLLWGLQYDGEWYDVGQKRDYLQVNREVLDGRLDLDLPYEKLPWGYLGTDVAIDFGRVEIRPPVIIGNHCIVEPGARLGPYAVIGDGWIVQSGVEIRHAVLWERYSYFGDDGLEVSARDRQLVDRHEVRRNVMIEESIIAGGAIEHDVRQSTVDVGDDGSLAILPIDYVPDAPRA